MPYNPFFLTTRLVPNRDILSYSIGTMTSYGVEFVVELVAEYVVEFVVSMPYSPSFLTKKCSERREILSYSMGIMNFCQVIEFPLQKVIKNCIIRVKTGY